MSERSGTKRKRHENGDSSKGKEKKTEREKVKPDPEKAKADREKVKAEAEKVKPDPEKVKPEPVVKNEEFSDDDETPFVKVKVEPDPEQSRQCPYLDTIDRNVLDFGMSNFKCFIKSEPFCSMIKPKFKICFKTIR